MIPKIIHQIWIGPKKIPQKWMDSWKYKNPNMVINIWNENSINKFGLINIKKYDFFMSKSIYDGAADIVRVEILERYGGVYLDADLICLLPIEDEFFMNKKFFANYEYDKRIANGIIGATPNHPIMTEYLKRMTETRVTQPPCYTIGGTMLTSCVDIYLAKNIDLEIEILPSFSFLPNWNERENIRGKIFARHMWGTAKKIY